MMKFIAVLLAALSFAGAAWASEGGMTWDRFPPERLTDRAALQNGAKLFVNHCLSCHSAAFMRYNRLQDIGLTEDQIKANLLFPTEKVGDTMKSAIDPKQAKDWFGATPPDLTLVARSRAGSGGSGADYLYTLLRTYYRDDSRATGWNNLAYPGIAMPHPLWELQGQRVARFESVKDPHGDGPALQLFKGYEQVQPGKLTAAQYDAEVADLVAFLQWMGEPAQQSRQRIGVWVLLYLGLFVIVAWRLNAAYWKDVK